MSISRRQFLWTAAASAVVTPALLHAQTPAAGSRLFRHGVASGDPLTDRVILWTRVTPPARQAAAVEVLWRIGTDPDLGQTVATGTVRTTADRDFTVKVDAAGLLPGRTYYFAFESGGERSAIGRTKTSPTGAVPRVRLAVVSCSNYPAGYFNVHRCLANRTDLDAVLHLGDYIYEFENGVYGDGTRLLRIPEPRKEAVTLSDYRIRYATYRTDPDLQEAHRLHPFVAVWDDHELTNDAWANGASNHNPDMGEGDWATRKAAAYRAYLEWMPIREQAGPGIKLYRSFRFGTLLDLVMLDTRGLRDRQAATMDVFSLTSASRSILGTEQEQWLFGELRRSQQASTGWRVIGQQVLLSPLVPPGTQAMLADTWDGYQASRNRLLELLASERIGDVAILGADLHSSWALDVPRNPWNGYQPLTGQGSLAVELLAPAISSPPLFADPILRNRAPALRALLPHLKLLEGERNGYLLVDITAERLLAEWFFVANVTERSAMESRGAAFVCERGSARLAAP